jgi:hypothetical protein
MTCGHFIFLDNHSRPFLCKEYGGELWLFYWHADKKWVSLRKTSPEEAERFPHNLTKKEQQMYPIPEGNNNEILS